MTASEHIVVDGYDLLAETTRETFPERRHGGRSLSRGHARLTWADTRVAASSEGGPLLADELASGLFVDSPDGLYMDLSQGVLPRIVDPQHPLMLECLAGLGERERISRGASSADEVVLRDELTGPHTAQDLVVLVNRLTREALPGEGDWETVLSTSSSGACDAALQLARLSARRRFLSAHGPELLRRLLDDLGRGAAGAPPGSADPFFIIGCGDAVRGLTEGLSPGGHADTDQCSGGPTSRWTAPVPFNGAVDEFEAIFDDRPISEILDLPGGVRQVINSGRIPRDLLAAFVVEVHQGQSGCRVADRDWFARVSAASRRRGALVCVDEVRSFGRTGQLYAVEHMAVTPDIIWTQVTPSLGIVVAREDLARGAQPSWPRDSLNAPGLAEVNKAWMTYHLLAEHREPVFEGRTLLENSRIKGAYMRMGLAELSAAHPDLLPEFSGIGCQWGLGVEHRDEVISVAWSLGLRLQACGPPGRIAQIPLFLVADVLTHEIDELMAALDRAFTTVEGNHPDA